MRDILRFILKRKLENGKQNEIVIDIFCYVAKFLGTISSSVIIFIIFYLIIVSECQQWYWSYAVLQSILFIQLLVKQSSLLIKARKFSDEERNLTKSIYWCYIAFLVIINILSYYKDNISYTLKDCEILSVHVIGESEFTIYDILAQGYQALLISKVSIEIVTVKDAIFQMNHWNFNRTITEYFAELVSNGKIYILKDDIENKNPRLWCIRGDACADLVDELEDFYIRKSNKFKIEFSKEQCEKIIEGRKSKKVYDPNDLLDCEQSNKHEYFFYVTLLDFSSYSAAFMEREIINKYRKEFMVFPSDVKVMHYKKVKIGHTIKKWLRSMKS